MTECPPQWKERESTTGESTTGAGTDTGPAGSADVDSASITGVTMGLTRVEWMVYNGSKL